MIDPRRRLRRPPAHDLHPEVAAPRRRRHHPRRTDRRGRRAPAAGRDLDPHRALRDAPSGRARHHRADRRGRRRRLRGERPDQPRRARADRPESHRGRARARDPGSARPGRRPARCVRLAVGRPAPRPRGSVAAICASSVRFVGRPPGRELIRRRRRRRAPSRRAAPAPATVAPHAGGARRRTTPATGRRDRRRRMTRSPSTAARAPR